MSEELKKKAKELGEQQVYPIKEILDETCRPMGGITLRQHYAGLAMQGLAGHWAQGGHSFSEQVSKMAVENADALLLDLSKP